MFAQRADLFARLEELGIPSRTVEHRPVFTVAESDELERELPGGHTKNLFLRDAKGELILIVAQSHTRIELKTLHKVLGCARLSFAKPELLWEVLGVMPGAVTVFGLINDRARRVSVVVDAALMTHASVNAHPLENTATTNIAREDVLRFIAACGHDPRIMVLALDPHTARREPSRPDAAGPNRS